jgi:hypothetical protein
VGDDVGARHELEMLFQHTRSDSKLGLFSFWSKGDSVFSTLERCACALLGDRAPPLTVRGQMAVEVPPLDPPLPATLDGRAAGTDDLIALCRCRCAHGEVGRT